MNKINKFTLSLFLVSVFVLNTVVVSAQTPIDPEQRPITFPVIGTVTYWDDFGAPRDGGERSHEGNDLMGRKMLPLVAAVDGTVRVSYPEESYGYSITIRDKDGYSYHYLHVNNDTPGTDDGKGGGLNAYSVDIDDGSKVVAGQLIGWMGDSGNAEPTQAHLHFEIRKPDRTPISPYKSLKAATKITKPVTPRPKQDFEHLPFSEFNGGGFIALNNADSDPAAEIAIGAGPGGGPHVKLINQDGTEIANVFPYAPGFRGGVDVALADVTGDGIAEIITAPGKGGGPHVKIFSTAGLEVGGFMAYDAKFLGGINIAAADVDNDGKAEIITAPGKGGGPHVRVFKADGTELFAFFAYDISFRAGIDVAAYSSTTTPLIVTSPLNGGGPHVKVFSPAGTVQSEFMAYDPTHMGGVRLTIGNIDNNIGPEVITVPLFGGSHARSFSLTGNNLGNDFGFEEWWPGSWDIAVYGDQVYMSSGPNTNRRASVRELDLDVIKSRF